MSDLPTARQLERRVARFIDERRLTAAGDAVLLAVSGGPDSLALLYILARTKRRHGAALIAAYVDHGIRPAGETEADRAFVAGHAAALGVPFVSARFASQPGARRSPEEAARLGRYRALARLAHDAHAAAVATGHTRSDQAETVLLRLLRGSGLRGLAAMAPVAPWPVPWQRPPALLRPLLILDRAETELYCDALGLVPRRDPENRNPRYLRNRVRAEILPALRAVNPRIETVLARLADEARDWQVRLDRSAPTGPAGRGAPGAPGHSLSLDVAALAREEPIARLSHLRTLLHDALPDRPAPSREHLLALDRLVLGPEGKGIDLPHGLRAQRRAGALTVERRRDTVPVAALAPDRTVPVPGELSLPGWRISSVLTDVHAGRWTLRDRWTALLAPETAAGLTVGPRRPGDRIELAGMQGRKRVQDLFVDSKVAREERDAWPVFRTERGIVWVAGLRVAAWAGAQGSHAVALRVERSADGSLDPSAGEPSGRA
jgi:tRNA(Ile)-lysidine synthase